MANQYNMQAINEDSMPETITRPRKIIPQGIQNTNFLWIKLRATELTGQATFARGEQAIKTGKDIATFYFVAPDSWPEDLTHSWEVYESFASRLLQKRAELGKTMETGKGVMEAVGESLKGWGKISEEQKRVTIKNKFDQISKAAGRTAATHYRIDTPLTYQGSERRKYIFTFNLVDEGNPEGDVLYPIRLLQRLSSPEMGNTAISVKLPSVFSIESFPHPQLLRVKHAALEKVTATYYGPWIDGYPIRAELQCEFTDLEPLYKSTYMEIPKVNATETTEKSSYIEDRLKNRAISEVFSRGRKGIRSVTGE